MSALEFQPCGRCTPSIRALSLIIPQSSYCPSCRSPIQHPPIDCTLLRFYLNSEKIALQLLQSTGKNGKSQNKAFGPIHQAEVPYYWTVSFSFLRFPLQIGSHILPSKYSFAISSRLIFLSKVTKLPCVRSRFLNLTNHIE